MRSALVNSAPAQPVVLVVDADSALRSALKFSLEVEGFLVREFRDAAALLAEQNLPANSCLVVESKLPDMSGLALIAELRGKRRAVPAILTSTHPNEQLKKRADAAGVKVIEKPLLNEDLIEAIRSALPQSS
jgi:two-component system, LuxR family, response regulator FixJ